jgi:two-component system NarL family response regulator
VPEILPADMIADDALQSNNQFLTGREHDVLSELLTGNSNKEIARNLSLSEVTIKHHLKSLRSKLGARNRIHAVCRAIKLGIS